jgi:hypothetical protein
VTDTREHPAKATSAAVVVQPPRALRPRLEHVNLVHEAGAAVRGGEHLLAIAQRLEPLELHTPLALPVDSPVYREPVTSSHQLVYSSDIAVVVDTDAVFYLAVAGHCFSKNLMQTAAISPYCNVKPLWLRFVVVPVQVRSQMPMLP